MRKRPETWRALVAGALVACAWLLVLGAAMGGVLARIPAPSWGSSMGECQSAEINHKQAAVQRFRAPMAGLSSVEVAVRPVHGAAGQVVTMRLAVGQEERLIAEKAVEVAPGALTSAVRLDFPGQGSSQGREYRLRIESTAPPGQGITVPYGPSSAVAGGAASIGDEPIAGGLQFQTGYSPTVWQKVDLTVGRLVAGAAGTGRGRGGLLAAAILYAGALGAYVWRTTRADAAEKEDAR